MKSQPIDIHIKQPFGDFGDRRYLCKHLLSNFDEGDTSQAKLEKMVKERYFRITQKWGTPGMISGMIYHDVMETIKGPGSDLDSHVLLLDLSISQPSAVPRCGTCQDMSQRPPHLPIKADFINFLLQQVWEVLGLCWAGTKPPTGGGIDKHIIGHIVILHSNTQM